MNLPLSVIVTLGVIAHCALPAVGESAGRGAVSVTGAVREWRPVPAFEKRHFSGQLSCDGDSKCVAGDLNCDGRAEVVSVNGRELNVIELLPSGTVAEQRSDLPFLTTDPRIVVGNFDGSGCNEIGVIAPDLGSVWFVMADLKSQSPRFLERKSPVSLPAVRYFARLVDAHQHHEIVGVTDGSAGEAPRVTRLVVGSGFEITGADLAISGEYLLSADGVADPLGSGDQQIIQRRVQQENRYRTQPSLPIWVFTTLPGYPAGRDNRALIFGQLSERIRWGAALIADFNGDLRDDVIVLPHERTAPWILVAVGPTAIEQPLDARLRISAHAFAGDVNGDGLADIIDPAVGGVTVYQSIPGRAIADATIRCGESETRSDAAGAFESAAEPTDACRVAAGDRKFLRPEIQVAVATSRHQLLNFLVQQPESERRGAGTTFAAHSNGPYVCIGYVPGPYALTKWGRQLECPPNHAFVEVDDIPSIVGSCCRLPAEDMLTDMELWTSEPACPPEYIVTGSRVEAAHQTAYRCTKIRTERYSLGASSVGTYWGIGLSAPEKQGGLSRLELPPALRAAVGRITAAEWDSDGCVSDPPGAFLIGAASKDCRRVRFAKIFERGLEGALPKPREIVPECARIENEYDPLSGCESAPESGAR